MPCAPVASPHVPVIRFRRLLAAACAVVGLVVLAAGCGSSKAGTSTSAMEKPDLTVAAVPAAGAAGLYIAAQDGYFTAAGLHVKIVPVASGSDALADLINVGSQHALSQDFRRLTIKSPPLCVISRAGRCYSVSGCPLFPQVACRSIPGCAGPYRDMRANMDLTATINRI